MAKFATMDLEEFFRDLAVGFKSIINDASFDFVQFIDDAKFRSIDLRECLKNWLGAVQKEYPNNAAEMALKAVIVSVAFGINVSRADRMTDTVKTFVNDITAKTKIKRGKGVEKSDEMTWQRLQLAFPFVRGVLLELNLIQPVGTVPIGLPKFYCGPGGASMIPNDKWNDSAFQTLYKKWLLSFAKQINRVNDRYKGKSDDDITADQMNFASLQQSNPFSDMARPGWWAAAVALRANLMMSKTATMTRDEWVSAMKTGTEIPLENFDDNKLRSFYDKVTA